MHLLEQGRSDSHSRIAARKLERSIVQFKAGQALREKDRLNVTSLSDEDPTLFDELVQKPKWTYVQKDPQRALKN